MRKRASLLPAAKEVDVFELHLPFDLHLLVLLLLLRPLLNPDHVMAVDAPASGSALQTLTVAVAVALQAMTLLARTALACVRGHFPHLILAVLMVFAELTPAHHPAVYSLRQALTVQLQTAGFFA